MVWKRECNNKITLILIFLTTLWRYSIVLNSRNFLMLMLIFVLVLFACSEHLSKAPTSLDHGPAGLNFLSKTGSFGSETIIYASFTNPANKWLSLADRYTVRATEGNHVALRSGDGLSDSIHTDISITTSKGKYQLTCYETSIFGSFFRFVAEPDEEIVVDCNNLDKITWITIGSDSASSVSSLDNWAGTGCWVPLPAVKGSEFLVWVLNKDGGELIGAKVRTWSDRSMTSETSSINLHYIVPSGDGWLFKFGVDEHGMLYNTGDSNIDVVITPNP
ncbi:MAG: hypothetical protein ABIF17_04855 [Patescibacteria group bacterium]